MLKKALFFYKHNCQHCKRAYTGVTRAISRLSTDVVLRTIDFSRRDEVSQVYGIEGTPTLVLDNDLGRPIKVTGVLGPAGYEEYFLKFFEEEKVY